MKKVLLLAAAAFAGYAVFNGRPGPAPEAPPAVAAIAAQAASNGDAIIADAFSRRRSDVQVAGDGQVVKLLADDNNGSRHQKFILRLGSGQTLLVSHNIDLAPRVGALQAGDTIAFYGEYEWSEKGGVVHWTHRDPRGAHAAGWLKHKGQTYQ